MNCDIAARPELKLAAQRFGISGAQGTAH